jgi:hypothetical protein
MEINAHENLLTMRLALLLFLLVAAFLPDGALADTCNAQGQLSYCSAIPTPSVACGGLPSCQLQNDVIQVRQQIGTGQITGGDTLTVNLLHFELDCSNGAIPCTDAGALVQYEGDSTITTDCTAVTWASNLPAGGSGTNDLQFSPSPVVQIPENTPNFCEIRFNVRILTSNPPTSSVLEVAGYDFTAGNATCNTTPTLNGGLTNTGQLFLCTPTPTDTPIATPTDTPTPTPTDTPTGVSTDTPTPTPTDTPTPTPTNTPTNTPANTPTPTPTIEICRGSTWWAQHAGTESGLNANVAQNVNVTQKVIDQAGRCIVVCGEKITNTNLNDAESAEEGLCVPAEGTSRKQLARYLIAASLNCAVNGGPADCSASRIAPVYAACDAACAAGGPPAVINECIEAGEYRLFHTSSYKNPPGSVVGLCANGNACTSSLGCTDGSTCTSPPAGSINKCNAANANSCSVVPCKDANGNSCGASSGKSEGNCGSGLECASPETCSQTTCQ